MDPLDHDRVKERFLEMFSLPADPDLTVDDLLPVPDLVDVKAMLGAYYPDDVSRNRALDSFEYIEKIMGHVAPRTLKASALKMLLDFEWLAHMRLKLPVGGSLPKFYRDHVLHPVYVCAIGWWMLSDRGPDPMRCSRIAALLEARYKDDYDDQDWEDIARRAWILASLNHDLLYPIEFLETLCKDEGVKKHTSWERRLRRSDVRRIYEGADMGIFQDQISKNSLEGLIRAGGRSHAPLSALYLIGPESGFAGASNRRKIIHELAAAAVLHHHSKDPNDIDYQTRPLGYLLALADECHEFGREMAVWTGQTDGFWVKFIPPILSSDITQHGNDFKITFHANAADKILMIEQAGFDKAIYSKGKTKGFERLNPTKPGGSSLNGFFFTPGTPLF